MCLEKQPQSISKTSQRFRRRFCVWVFFLIFNALEFDRQGGIKQQISHLILIKLLKGYKNQVFSTPFYTCHS